MGDLIWQQRPLWASLEYWLHSRLGQTISSLKATPKGGSYSQSFSSGWQAYYATDGDWYGALGHFDFVVKGDVWIGPASSSGVRPVQIRYRSAVSDVYNFANSGDQKPFYDVASKGWAAEYWVSGDTKVITLQTNSSVNVNAIGFEW